MDKRSEAEFAEDMNVLNNALRGMSELQDEWDEEEAAEKAAEAKEKEITILRELVRDVRIDYEGTFCACSIDGYKCVKCSWMDRIDTDLAKIGELEGK